jgi:alanyl-tRNA synthetase
VFGCSEGIALDIGSIMKQSVTVMGGRGGGGPTYAQGGGGDRTKLEAVLDEAERLVREVLG